MDDRALSSGRRVCRACNCDDGLMRLGQLLRMSIGVLIGGGVAVVIAGCAVGASIPGNVPATQSTPTPTTKALSAAFTANGSVSTPIDEAATQALAGNAAYVGGPCAPPTGYSDVHAEAQVVIADARGQKIAVGELEPGTAEQGPTESVADGRCVFNFEVDDVPGTSDLYSVHVGNTFRGEATYSKHDLYTGVDLALG